MQPIGYITAYPRKESLGGGFRAIFKNKLTGEVTKSEVLPTIEEAWNWARCRADDTIRPITNGRFEYSPVRWQKDCERRAFYYDHRQ